MNNIKRAHNCKDSGGESCTGCPQCYVRSGVTVCEHACEHAEPPMVVTPKRITYRLEVAVTQRLSDDPDDPDYPTREGATTAAYKRRLERDVADCLYRLKLKADVELMDFTVGRE